MKRICSYCEQDLGEDPSRFPIEGVTHGVCDDCLLWLRNGMNQSLRDYLNKFDFPVLLVDSNVDVKMANDEAKDFIGKDLSEIEGYKGGDAIECEHARLPGGCGNTIHCTTCTIRNVVTDTSRSGENFKNIPAYQNIYSSNGVVKKHLKISTENFSDLVLLKIDPVEDTE